MRLNSKLTWGLAWAGVAVVLAVPSMDFLTGSFGAGKAVLTSTTEPVRTSSVTTTVTPNGIKITPSVTGSSATKPAPADPVSIYLKTNKALPDYLSDGTAADSSKPTIVATPAPKTSAVAAIDPQSAVAPMPYPSWARPTNIVAKPAPKAAEPALIIDETAAASEPPAEVAVEPLVVTVPRGPIPPAPIIDDSANWRDAGLSRYLESEGLLDTGPTRSTATVTQSQPSNDYDPDGFYLSDGPNDDRAARRRARVRRLLEEDNSDPNLVLF